MKKDTNNLVSFYLIFFALLIAFGIGFWVARATTPEPPETLVKTGIVIRLDTENDLVTVRHFNDNRIFVFEGVEDWLVGDIASCIVDENGTVIRPLYVGYVEEWE